MKNHGSKVAGKLVFWDYVRAFYNGDCRSALRLAPNLKQKHIDSSPFVALRVKRATRSPESFRCCWNAKMVQWEVIPEDSTHTAAFIEK